MSQVRYINYISGTDVDNYSGSVDKPFKTLSHALTRAADGDELQIIDVTMMAGGDIYHEDSTIEIENRHNLTIRFGTISKAGKSSGIKWEIGSGNLVMKMTGCTDIKIIGATFICDNEFQTGCIEAIDCNDIEIYSCTVSGFKVNDSAEKLFHAVRSTITLNNVAVTDLTSEIEGDIKFVDIAGDSIANIYSCSLMDYNSDGASITAVHVDQDVRTLNINGLFVHNCESNTEKGSVGIVIDSDESSFISFDIMNCQFSNIRTGISVRNLPPAKKQTLLRIASSTFYKCCHAIDAYDSDFTITNVSIYGLDTEDHQYEHGDDLLDTYGVFAEEGSSLDVMNTVITYCNTAFAALSASLIDVSRTIFCDNNYFKEEQDDGEVRVDDYVRAADPCYKNIEGYPYGNFRLANNSPCINAGKLVGLEYSGIAPTIGAIDQDRYISSSDIVSIAARQVRDAETYYMSETDVEDLIVSGIKALNPDTAADREGSAIRDLFVKPITELSKMFIGEIENIRNSMSFLNVDTMSDDDADALAANLIVYRRNGAKATGVVRMFFDKAFDFELPAETMFSTRSGLHFYSISKTVVTKEEMQANLDGNLYFAEIIVEGEAAGASYNISPGEITSCDDVSLTSLMTVTNESYFTGGETKETNTELYERIKLAITTRCLNTVRGVKFQFIEAFSFLRRVTVIGKGDPEMIRDDLLSLLEGTGVTLPDEFDGADLTKMHIGGKTDVYTQVYEPINDSVTVDAVPALATLSELGLTDKPILRINSIEICYPESRDSMGTYIPENKWKLISNDARVRFSVRENMSLEIDEEYVGNTIKINYMWVYEVPAMQKWAESDDNRVICEDILVKHCQPAFANVSLAYHAPEEVTDMEDLIREYIKSIPEKKSLRVSSLIDFVYEHTAVHVITPLLITAELHKNDGSIERYESYDEIVLERTACFVPDQIETLYLGEDPL